MSTNNKTALPTITKLPEGFVLVPKYQAKRIIKLEQHLRDLDNYTFGRIPHGDTATFETYKALLDDLNEAIGIRPIRTDRAWGPLATEPTPITTEGYVCSTGAHFFASKQYGEHHSQWLASYCCGPYKCHLCGAEVEKSNTWCKSCSSKREEDAWHKAGRVEANGMVYSETWGRFFNDLDDYLEHCADKEVEPEDGRPWNCEFIPAGAPSLAELINDEMYDDWEGDEPWLDDLQKQIDAAFHEHKPGAWHQSNTVPILPESTTKTGVA